MQLALMTSTVGQMTVVGTNGHASFIVTNSTATEQNAFIVWHGTPTAAEDWTADITGHNTAFHPSCQLQLAVVNTEVWHSGAVDGFVVSMANHSSGFGRFGSSAWHYPGGYTPRASISTTSTDFKLRLVYHAATQTIEAWYAPTASAQSWMQLDSMTLNEFSPGMTATNTFSFAILGNTDYGPISEGEIWADDFNLLGAPLQFASSPSVSSGLFQMQLTGPPNASVILQASSNLTNWTAISTNTLPAGGLPLSWPIGTNRQQFYRAWLGP